MRKMTFVSTLPTGHKLYGGAFRGQVVSALALTTSGRVVGRAGKKTINMSVADFLRLTVKAPMVAKAA